MRENCNAPSQQRRQPSFYHGDPAGRKGPSGAAAALEHTTLKDFLLRNSLSAAEVVIERAERVALSERDTRKVLDLLDNPPAPNERMVAILEARKVKRRRCRPGTRKPLTRSMTASALIAARLI